MLKRVLTGVVAFAIFVPFVIFSYTLDLLLPLGIALCSVIAVWEILHCVGLHKNVWLSLPLYPVAAALPVLMGVLESRLAIKVSVLAVLLLILYSFGVCVLSHGKVKITEMSVAVLTCIYSMTGMAGIIYLCDLQEGGFIFMLVFTGAWVTDIFAYFTGFLFGKHKLIPDVSPKKTVEGSIGGILFCTLAFVGFTWVYNQYLMPEGGTALSYLIMIPVGIVSSVVSQVGDLSMSVLKRHYGIKDFGKIFPGHGGVMDRFDSALAVSVLLSVALSIFF